MINRNNQLNIFELFQKDYALPKHQSTKDG